jgi:hypothetical protein
MTENEATEGGYDKAIAQLQEAKDANQGFVVYIDQSKGHTLHMHNVSIVNLCQLVASIYQEHPSARFLVDEFLKYKTSKAA